MAIFSRKGDIETGNNGQLYPGMMESPQMRWAFIRKVYSILSIQLLITFGIALGMYLVEPVREFMRTKSGLYVMIAAIVIFIVVFILLLFCQERHPWNYILLFLFTIATGFMIGAVCTQHSGQAVLMAAGLTLLITIGLTLFTFGAAKMGFDFQFLGPFLFCALLILIAFGFIRIFFPMGRIGTLLIACAGALIFSIFIIYDTDNLIKRFTYDQYVLAAMSLYLDIINLFLYLLQILDGDN